MEVMDTAGEVMQDEEVERCGQSLQAYQEAYAALAGAAEAAGELLWKLRPKFHALSHMTLFMEVTHLNPRFWACWMDEDFMGKCRQMCQRTKARGDVVSRAALVRYLWARAEMCHARVR